MENEFVDIFLYGDNMDDSTLSNPIELFFQEIELAVKILPYEVWGVKESLNLKRYILNRYVTITQIKNEIINYISKNCEHSRFFSYNISIENIKGPNNKDLIYIVVSVDGTNTSETFKQKFLLGS